MCGCGCSGKSTARNLRIGGNLVGIAEIDKILRVGLELNGAKDAELKSAMMNELKRYNYVPPSMEAEYAEAILKEYRRCESK